VVWSDEKRQERDLIMKKCSKCGKLKKESDFPKDRTRKDGLHQRCKACKNAYSRQRYKTKQGASKGKVENKNMKKCSGCGKLKPRSEYSKDRTKKDGLYHLCKVCRSSYRSKNKKKKAKVGLKKQGSASGTVRDNKDVGVLAIVHAGDECGVCSVCGKILMGFIPGYLHGQPVCKECVIVNLKSVFMGKRKKK
jgi:hypothetical protein